MEKPFLEVFPGLHIGEELKELLKLVMVEKVSMPKDRSSLRIYIVSPRLIHKKNMCSMEEGIAKQLFPGRSITVKILEKYRLSAQYTPEKLYQVYKDSILMEFKNFGMIEYNILRRAETAFEAEDTMVMTIEDNLIYRERSKEVGRILEKIFTERCGLPAEVRFSFIKAEKERRDDFDEEAALAALLASHVQDMGGGQEETAGSRGQEEGHGDPGGGAPWPRIKSLAPGPLQKRPLERKKLLEEKGIPSAGPETAASRTALAPALSGTAAEEEECPTGSRRIPMCFTAVISRARPWRSMRSQERSARWSYGERSSGWKKGNLEAAAR